MRQIVSKRFYTQLSQSSPKLDRFYKQVAISKHQDYYTIDLDTKPIKTTNGECLKIPLNRSQLAYYLADEWDQQDKVIKPHSLPITSLCMRTLASLDDKETREGVIDALTDYIDTDSICYHQDYPESFVSLQQKYWLPIISFINMKYKIDLKTTNSVQVIKQDPETRFILKQAVTSFDDFKLAAFEKIVLKTKSFMIGLAVIERAISVEFAERAARLEVVQQINKWGEVEDSHDVDREEMRRQIGSAVIASLTDQ